MTLCNTAELYVDNRTETDNEAAVIPRPSGASRPEIMAFRIASSLRVLGALRGKISDHSDPLVEGVTPAMRGSGSTAMRRARPKALKIVSAW